MLSVIANGYGNELNNIRAQLGMTDLEYRYATQLAIWYWTDGYDASTADPFFAMVDEITQVPNADLIFRAYQVLTGQDASLALAATPLVKPWRSTPRATRTVSPLTCRTSSARSL